MEVRISPTRTVDIRLRPEDDPDEVAVSFCESNSLHPTAALVISRVLKDNLKAQQIEIEGDYDDEEDEEDEENDVPPPPPPLNPENANRKLSFRYAIKRKSIVQPIVHR